MYILFIRIYQGLVIKLSLLIYFTQHFKTRLNCYNEFMSGICTKQVYFTFTENTYSTKDGCMEAHVNNTWFRARIQQRVSL